MFVNFLFKVFLFFIISNVVYSSDGINIYKVKIDIYDNLSLKNGADIYMKNCVGCHSLKYIRFNSIISDIGLNNEENYIKNNWFYSGNINDFVMSPLDINVSSNWFGVVPPDLSLVSRYAENSNSK